MVKNNISIFDDNYINLKFKHIIDGVNDFQ